MKFILCVVLKLAWLAGIAQPEAGLIVGGAAFLGDLGGNRGKGKPFIKDLQARNTEPLAGLYYSQGNIGIQFIHSRLSGADSLTKGSNGAEQFRKNRGLYFSSPLNELTIYTKRSIGILYATVGGGVLAFKPNPLFAEGRYSLYQPVITYGAGVNIPVSFNYVLGFNIQGRKLFTDYIDDVHERGLPDNDSYIIASIRFGYIFKKDFLSCPKL